ncbi:hypothetical protein FC697_20470 [Bacillus wiedmannii]|nr:hypothetical protein FC697_20470 [Bacillus wiedmannii]
MIALIQNEFLKIHVKKTLYFFVMFLLSITIITALIIKNVDELNMNSFLDFSSFIIPIYVIPVTIFGITIASRTLIKEFQ